MLKSWFLEEKDEICELQLDTQKLELQQEESAMTPALMTPMLREKKPLVPPKSYE